MLMSTEVQHNYKLTQPQRMQVLAMLARGDRYAAINKFLLEQYGVQLHVSNFTEMKKRHADTIAAMQATITTNVALEAEVLLAKSRKLINRKLDKAADDAEEIDELDRQYRESEIDHEEYTRRRKGLLTISIGELNQVSKEMFAQSNLASSDGDKGPKTADSNPDQTKALIEAIQNGDTVELQRMILNPKATA